MRKIKIANWEINEMTRCEFLEKFPSIMENIFDEKVDSDNNAAIEFRKKSFANSNWQAILLAGTPFDYGFEYMAEELEFNEMAESKVEPVDFYSSILIGLWPWCKNGVFFSHVPFSGEGWAEDAPVFTVPPVPSVLKGIRDAMEPGMLHTASIQATMLFDASGKWGILGYAAADDSVLAGEPDVVARVVAHLGGLDRVQERFAAWCLIRYGGMKDLPAQLERFRPVYDSIGWPWPFDAWTAPEKVY
ncbi:MAG: hypothetical protein VYB54_09750 [Pseudomonadota bacterium]|nr:hypothetical protein [Pseudomonadota bacterium]